MNTKRDETADGERIALFGAEHLAIAARLADVDKLLENEFSWDDARIALVELRTALEAHFAMEETSGHLSEIAKYSPGRILIVATLESEHSRMRGTLARLLAEALVARSREDLRGGVSHFVATLADHERRENELVASVFSPVIPAKV